MRPTRHPGPFHDHAATMPPPHLAAHLATARHAPLAPRPPAAPPPAPPRPTQQAAAGSGASADDDGVDGYAERLSREAQQRERPADEEGEEAESGAASIQDLLQQMMGGGGADGPVVKFEVVLGDGTEGAGAAERFADDWSEGSSGGTESSSLCAISTSLRIRDSSDWLSSDMVPSCAQAVANTRRGLDLVRLGSVLR